MGRNLPTAAQNTEQQDCHPLNPTPPKAPISLSSHRARLVGQQDCRRLGFQRAVVTCLRVSSTLDSTPHRSALNVFMLHKLFPKPLTAS